MGEPDGGPIRTPLDSSPTRGTACADSSFARPRARFDTEGTHLLVEYLDCAPAFLDDAVRLEAALRAAAGRIGARVVTAAFHRFAPQGVTGFLLLEESHLSIHTWPERRYAAVDLYSCGAAEPELALPLLGAALGAARVCTLRVVRGEVGEGVPLRVIP